MSRQQLRPARTPRWLSEYWAGEDPRDQIQLAMSLVAPGAEVAPLVRLGGSSVFPVIDAGWDGGQGQVMLVSAAPISRAWRDLSTLRGIAPCLVALPPDSQPSLLDLCELDFLGLGAIQLRHDHLAEVLLTASAALAATPASSWREFRLEQVILFGSGYAPTREGWLAIHAPR